MINIKALHHVRLGSTDVSASSLFATDFGLQVAATAGHDVYFRGAGRDSYNLVFQPSAAAGLISVGFTVESREDLERAVRDHGGTAIRDLEIQFGGSAVTLTDPEGNHIDLVVDIQERAPDALRPSLMINHGLAKDRKGVTQHKPPLSAPQLLRLGHVGLFVRNYAACDAWYRDVLGLLASDLMHAGPPDNVIAGFYRLNHGAEFVDHHTLAMFGMGRMGVHHISFEVQDSEAQFIGHRLMKKQGHELVWGIGRHQLGSHIFDVWRGPDGYRFETYTDTDLCTSEIQPALHAIETVGLDLWSDDSFERYFA